MNLDDIPSLVDVETRVEVLTKYADKFRDGMVVVEIGSYLGYSGCLIASRIRENKVKTQLHCIDNWLFENISDQAFGDANITREDSFYNKFMDNVRGLDLQEYIIPIKSDGIEAAKLFEDKSVSFLWLDGEHGYPYTTNEIKAWLPKMAMNSIICGHDYCSSSGIRQSVSENFGSDFSLTSNEATYIVQIGAGL